MPRGAFYAYPNLSGVLGKPGVETPFAFAETLLKEEQVATVPGEAFGTNAHVRISYATSMEQIAKGLDRIERFVRARL